MPPRKDFIERLQALSRERHREQAKMLRLKDEVFEIAETVRKIDKPKKPKGRPRKEKVAQPLIAKRKVGRPRVPKREYNKKVFQEPEPTITRPPAEYSNTSPYGIAAALHFGNNF
jgi:hypothetical protein